MGYGCKGFDFGRRSRFRPADTETCSVGGSIPFDFFELIMMIRSRIFCGLGFLVFVSVSSSV